MTLNLDQTKHFTNKYTHRHKTERKRKLWRTRKKTIKNKQKKWVKSWNLEVVHTVHSVFSFTSFGPVWLCLMNEYSHFPSCAKQQTFTQISPKIKKGTHQMHQAKARQKHREVTKKNTNRKTFPQFHFLFQWFVELTQSLLHFNFSKVKFLLVNSFNF